METALVKKTDVYFEKPYLVDQMLGVLRLFQKPGLRMIYNPNISNISVFMRSIDGMDVLILIAHDDVSPYTFVQDMVAIVRQKKQKNENLRLVIAGNEGLTRLYSGISGVSQTLRGIYTIDAVEKVLRCES